MHRRVALVMLSLVFSSIAAAASATPVTLQNATASFTQSGCSGTWAIGEAIDSVIPAEGAQIKNGWAIADASGTPTCTVTNPATAWFETTADQANTAFTFTLTQWYGNFHTIGDLTLSYTTSSRVGGFSDANATWTALSLFSASATNGATLSIIGNEVQAGGTSPDTSIYTITTNLVGVTGITGFRLQTLANAAYPFNGPGRQPTNGNFVLTEFEVGTAVGVNPNAAVPEPATLVLFGLGLALTGAIAARRRSRA